MRYFANPSTPKVREAMSAGLLDCILTPKQGNRLPDGAYYVADNGCFGKGYPGDDAWWAWLTALPARDRCLFAVAPDVVGDAAATAERSRPWLARIRELGIPAAFVAQNGIEHMAVPWDAFDVLFLGGSLECVPCSFVWPAVIRPKRGQECPGCGRVLAEWKLGAAARDLTMAAKERGKRVHMGRVNAAKRLDYATFIGCDTADGTFIAFAPDQNLPKVLRWLDKVHEPSLLDLSYSPTDPAGGETDG